MTPQSSTAHDQKLDVLHSRPQSLRAFWPAAGTERLWEQPFQACAIDEDLMLKENGSLGVVCYMGA